jgi:UDP-N-acetylglucosamine:LPS N-acetylglucosamine transferase
MFADMLREQLKASGLKSLLVCGEVVGEEKKVVVDNYTEVNYLTSETLNTAISQSDVVIARSGYSTVMDLDRMGKKAIFIPTPGQTEQTYLAAQLMSKGIAFSMEQRSLNLKTALKEANKFGGFTNFGYVEALLDKAIQSVL